MIQHFDGKFDKFEDVKLEPIDKDAILAKMAELDQKLVSSASKEEAIAAIREFFVLFDDVVTAINLISIRHVIDTRDEEYKKLNDLIDEFMPEFEGAYNKFNQDFIASKYREDLEKTFGTYIFDKALLSSKTFKPEIIPDLQEENKLSSEYTELLAKALIEYKGEKYSIPQMGKFTSSLDREVREEANKLVWGFYSDNDEKIGDIYDRMVKVRTRIAKKLGYENFLQLGYDRMGRLDWNADDAKVYREKILTYIVPLSNKIYAAQKERLGFGDDTRFHDYAIFYKSGNPKPHGETKELVEAASRMYKELSPVASYYFDFMVDHHCLDLEAKPGKAGGGFMSYLPGLKTAFIFSNANGTSGDVDVLTHEFGHSLQGFLGSDNEVPDYRQPGLECCEMHSMSMEFLTHPWMEYFFKEDANKYRYKHTCDAITFIPYGCIVDAFQTYCYENPDLTPTERKAYWRELEKTYLPHRQYKDIPFLENGGFWMRQSHIFQNPLYYLDYTIAQVVALELFSESMEDKEKTLEKYMAFCRLGGTLPFRALLKKAGIANPFDGDTLKDVCQSIMAYLDTFNPNELDK